MATSEAQEIKKQETLVRFSILSSKTRLCVLQQCPSLDLCKLDMLTGRIRLIIPNFHKLSSKNMCQIGQYHTFIFLPFFGFNLKFHNLYNSTPNFYLHSTYVGRQPVCTSQITTYVQWKALSSFHSFNSPAHLDISRRFDVLEQIRDYCYTVQCNFVAKGNRTIRGHQSI